MTKSTHSDGTYRVGIIMGISVGALFLVAGFILCLLGLSGTIEWLVKGGGFTSRLTNASPGALFAVVGLIVVIRYKPKITAQTQTDTQKATHVAPSGGSYSYTRETKYENKTSGSRLSS
jgi:hypothetical protein